MKNKSISNGQWLIAHGILLVVTLISLNFLSQPMNTTVKPTALNVYKEPKTNAAFVGQVTTNKKISVLQAHKKWLQVQLSNGNIGWVKRAQYEEAPIKNNLNTITTVAQKTDLKISSTNTSDTIKSLQTGARITVYQNKSGWSYVKDSTGTFGWVKQSDVVVKKAKKVKKQKTKSSSLSLDAKSALKNKVIVIDPGHGGDDVGSLSNDNRYEKTATLQTSKALAQALRKKGAKVIMTRSTDDYISLKGRTEIAENKEADAFICIHYDSTEDKNVATGTTTYYYHDNSKALANAINQQLVSLPLSNRGVDIGNYQVLRDNTRPSVLLELGYMSTDTDANYAFSSDYQEQVATDIVKGLENYFTNPAAQTPGTSTMASIPATKPSSTSATSSR